tara:strand:+ start:311 stop:766 length:456 start_codon:yes stop_codon:yes gene_type:complete
MVDRSNRETATREKQVRKAHWTPPSTLEAPEAPVGYKHRWIRERVMDYDDKANIYKRQREGYELVRAEDYPDFDAPVIDEGKNAGVIGQGGLILARIPEEIVNERNDYFREKTSTQMEAVDRDLMKESNPAMPISKDRKSQVAFGGKRNNN